MALDSTYWNGSVNVTVSANITNATVADVDEFQCRLFRLILYTVAMGLLSLVGFAGNTISFLVLNKDKSTPVASFLLQSLAIADNTFLVLWLIHYAVKDAIRFLEISQLDYPAWMYIRVYTFPILYMGQMQTIWLTVVIALNRFMAVCLPYRAPHMCTINNVYKEVTVVTLFSIVYNIPRFFELQLHQIDGKHEWNYTEFGSNIIYVKGYRDASYYLFTFILPLLILAFVNTKIIVAYRATQQRRQRMTSSLSARRVENDNNITLVMIMVVVIFMLCQAPARIVQMALGYKFNSCVDYQFYVIHISNTLEVLNSSVNFLIYCIFHKRFRDILQQHFCCGPLATNGRRNSTRCTTTEGLSLEEMAKTSASSKKGSSIKSSSQEQNKNGSLPNMPNEKVTAVVVTANDGQLSSADETEVVVPLRQDSPDDPEQQDDVNMAENCIVPGDDATIPLSP